MALTRANIASIEQIYGGMEWYQFVKKYCCNFKMKQEDGVCYELYGLQRGFKARCSTCGHGKTLNAQISALDRMEKGEARGGGFRR